MLPYSKCKLLRFEGFLRNGNAPKCHKFNEPQPETEPETPDQKLAELLVLLRYRLVRSSTNCNRTAKNVAKCRRNFLIFIHLTRKLIHFVVINFGHVIEILRRGQVYIESVVGGGGLKEEGRH